MSNPLKDRISSDIQKAKESGSLRTDRIREIVQSAVSAAMAEVKEGSSEIRIFVKDAVDAVIENFKDKGGELKEEITASVEGGIEAISNARRQAIAKNQAELTKLQSQIDSEETQLQEEIDGILTEVQQTGETQPSNVKTAVDSAVETLKDSEEVALMRKRYAQLQSQIAVIQANLAARYGERYEDAKKYLEDAKNWYDRAQAQAGEKAEYLEVKRTEFETKLSEAGSALARKEQRVKQILKELWQSTKELVREK